MYYFLVLGILMACEPIMAIIYVINEDSPFCLGLLILLSAAIWILLIVCILKLDIYVDKTQNNQIKIECHEKQIAELKNELKKIEIFNDSDKN